MKNKTFKTFLLITCLSLVSILVCEFFPASRFDVLVGKWKWIESKIFSKRKTIDYAIIGSSLAWCAIKSNLISRGMKVSRVWNFGRNWDGRDIDYIMLKKLVEHHDVKNVLIQFHNIELLRVHPYTKYIISPGDALDEAVYYLKDTNITDKESVKTRINTILSYLGNLSVRTFMQIIRKNPGVRGWIKKRNDREKGFYIYSNTVKQIKEKFKKVIDKKWELTFDQSTSFPSRSRAAFYLDKIYRLCRKHNVKIYFVFLPRYMRPLPAKCTIDYFSKIGDVLVPDIKGITKMKYWWDPSHLFKRGPGKYTRRLVWLLKKGKEASPYSDYYNTRAE